jgi:hypothetical protein
MTDQQLTTAELVAEMVEIREEKRKIKAREKELNERWRTLELELLIRLDDQGMEKASVKDVGTASINETVLPQVVDWDSFYEYIKENDALFLLQRRPAAAAYRELLESDQTVPGVEPYTQRSIGLRKA